MAFATNRMDLHAYQAAAVADGVANHSHFVLVIADPTYVTVQHRRASIETPFGKFDWNWPTNMSKCCWNFLSFLHVTNLMMRLMLTMSGWPIESLSTD